ncbi:MAG: FHA domain-containing protein [Planctomycetota bacterium]|nr:FHA domain-containing protein [Planctomycetota bacterium]
MGSLIVQSRDRKMAAVFRHRVLIGRKPFNGLQIDERVVSRIHAWIDQAGDGFYIADAKSRGGTHVNGEPLTGKRRLSDGDHIAVGQTSFMFQENDDLPADAVVFEIGEDGSNPVFKNRGILLKCSCDAPVWVPTNMAGTYGVCAICDDEVIVPGAPLTGIRRPLTPNDAVGVSPPVAAPKPVEAESLAKDTPMMSEPAHQTCSICQSAILPGDPIETCGSCSNTYHAECWRENLGCAAYGCANVGALAPAADVETAQAATQEEQFSPAMAATPFPWDFALLGASVFATILGALTFGVPALGVGTTAAIYALRSRAGRSRVAALSALISLVGTAGGAVMSWYWWLDFSMRGLK